MIRSVLSCDFCEQPFKVTNGTVILYSSKELNTKDLFPHLCENCAKKLDKTMLFCKKRWAKEGDCVAQIAELNAARKALLNTKG